MLTFHKTAMDGLWMIESRLHKDERGWFAKSFHDALFREQGIHFEVRESFCSFSGRNVIRGMHFQAPPHAHAKLVFTPQGKILDVVIDLRQGPGYGKVHACELSQDNSRALFIPEGFAHGFSVLSESALVVYQVSREHAADYDLGIRWDSFGFDWQVTEPVVSERDRLLPDWQTFQSPFGKGG